MRESEPDNTPRPGATTADCDGVRERLVDLDLAAAARRALADDLTHAVHCPACRAAMADFDALRSLLSDADAAVPVADSAEPVETFRLVTPEQKTAFNWRPAARAAVAVIAVGVAAFVTGRYASPRTPRAGAPSPVAAAAFAPGEADRQARAFARVSDAFDGRADWVLVSDAASDVGLADRPAATGRLVLLRLSVTPRAAGSRAASVSSADLAILPGRPATLTLPFPDGRTLRYQIVTSADTPVRLVLRADLYGNEDRADHGSPLAVVAATLNLRPDAATPAGSFVTGSDEYELSVGFSTATLGGRGTP